MTETEFKNNIFLLSMIGYKPNVDKFKILFDCNPVVFWGIDTKNPILDLKFKKSERIPDECNWYINNFSGALGCHMNHYYAIYFALISGRDFVVMMEDDVFPISDFDVLQESFDELPKDWECLNFGWIPSIVRRERGLTPHEYSKNLYTNEGMACSGAFGYILNRKGMEKALSILSDIRVPVDFIFNILKTFYCKTPYVGHPPAEAPSRIR